PSARPHPETLEPVRIEERQPDTRLDERHPADRRADPRQLLDQLQPLDRLGFEAADLTREHRPADAVVVERLPQRRRDAPRLNSLLVLSDQRLEAARDTSQRSTLAVGDLGR